ncbi:hypothetical protein FRC17_006347, partial [Serendipita sp. 399]
STTPPRDEIELDAPAQPGFSNPIPPSGPYLRRPRSSLWSLDSQQVQQTPLEPVQQLSSSVSPQEVIPPHQIQPPIDFSWAAQAGRQGARAQSFDDYLRIHKLQESGILPPTQSAPSMPVALPPYLHDQFHPQSQMQHDGPRGPVWDLQQHESLSPQRTYNYERPDSDMGYPESMGLDPLYEPPAEEDHYNDASWRLFMDGLGL